MSRELMQQALEALVAAYQGKDKTGQVTEAIAALRERLAQPEQDQKPPVKTYCGGKPNYCIPEQEPVAWADMAVRGEDKGLSWTPGHFHKTPLYIAPPKREWVGLTADEIWKCNKSKSGSAVEFHICYEHQNVEDFAASIEAKLKEKNDG